MDNIEFLNAYQIMDITSLKWLVATYVVSPIDGSVIQHDDRGKIKDIVWQLKNLYKERCKGYGFVIDLDKSTMAVPSTWDIPIQNNFNGYRVFLSRVFEAQALNPEHEVIIKGILRESIKRHFKDVPSDELGELWQDYGDFCQLPFLAGSDTFFCRKFVVTPEFLAGNCWVLKLEVVTKLIDSRKLSDYYENGEVKRLADMVRLKRANRLTRKNEPFAIRVWYESALGAEVLELEEPEQILEHASLNPLDQKKMAGHTIRCKRFKKPSTDIPLSQLHLILDPQIVQEDHDETIIDPTDRYNLYSLLRNYLDGMDAYNHVINLASDPISIGQFNDIHILPPDISLRVSNTEVGVLPAPKNHSIKAIETRAKDRARAIRNNGYLEQRPINPLLACHISYGENRAKRLQEDLNRLLDQQGLDFRFGAPLIYKTVHDIVRDFEQKSYDSLFAVLPEGKYVQDSDIDTHEQIKKQVEAPSQCIHHDNTLSSRWLNKSWEEIRSSDSHYARRIENQYLLCIQNLLVKHNWIPFIPANPFYYNVHVGIDVGGKHNNRVMASIGYGFMKPSEGLVFLPKEIQIDTQKTEPIPTKYLYDGLYSVFEELYNRLKDAGILPDFNRILFFRDGVLRGQGDLWNEIDALTNLQQTLLKKNWIDDDAMWTAVEVSKRAGDWRILRSNAGQIENPIVGRCVFPFRDNKSALICTTGSPYLSQGTASPLFVRIKDIYREATREQVLTDLIWEADMCYTKLDMGMSLPWVLHIADIGALQQSKAYKITGITV